jgi:acyl-CoA synthetase (AMP-forming)/AMP-acid ligase II
LNLADRIEQAARRWAGDIVLLTVSSDPDDPGGGPVTGRTTWQELYSMVIGLCSGLADGGLRRGDRLAVLMHNSCEMVASEWACLVAGFVWVSFNTRSTAAELTRLLADCSPGVLLVSNECAGLVGSVQIPEGCRLVFVGGKDWSQLLAAPIGKKGWEQEGWAAPAEDDPVRIRYTSGTSGKPRGAVQPLRCYDASVDAVTEVLGDPGRDEVLLQVAPMTHAAGAMLLPCLLGGGRAVLLDRFDARCFGPLVRVHAVTSVFLVPTMLARVLDRDAVAVDLSSLRRIIYGGAPMPVHWLLQGLELLGQVFIQIYGLTECTWPVTTLLQSEHPLSGSLDERSSRLRSCGRPARRVEVRVVDELGRDVVGALPGEVLLRGPNMMSGYWRAGRKSTGRASADEGDPRGLDEQGWMHTGDLGFFDDEGFLTVLDRLDDTIITGGFNVYPREVEDALSSHPAVLESAVVGRDDPEWGRSVHAVVVCRPGTQVDEQELKQHCAALLSDYKKPRTVEFADSLPRNPSGKTLRRVLRS